MNYGELIMNTEHVLCYGSHMFRQFFYCSYHCYVVAQLLAVQSSANTQKGAYISLISLKERHLKRRAAKRVNRQIKKRYLFRTTKTDCLIFQTSGPIFKTWNYS